MRVEFLFHCLGSQLLPMWRPLPCQHWQAWHCDCWTEGPKPLMLRAIHCATSPLACAWTQGSRQKGKPLDRVNQQFSHALNSQILSVTPNRCQFTGRLRCWSGFGTWYKRGKEIESGWVGVWGVDKMNIAWSWPYAQRNNLNLR